MVTPPDESGGPQTRNQVALYAFGENEMVNQVRALFPIVYLLQLTILLPVTFCCISDTLPPSSPRDSCAQVNGELFPNDLHHLPSREPSFETRDYSFARDLAWLEAHPHPATVQSGPRVPQGVREFQNASA